MVSKIKSVCNYTSQMESIGGIESVIRCLIPIFQNHGINSWTACEYGVPCGLQEGTFEVFSNKSFDRLAQWDTFIARHTTDVVIIHHVNSPSLEEEVAYLRKRGIICIRVMHSSFPTAMMLGGEEMFWRDNLSVCKSCDLTVTVSSLDAEWWRALGVKALHVQNPFVRPSKNVETIRRTGADGAANLLWVGRLCEPKQPKAALAAFAHAVKECPNATLTIVGGTAQGNKLMLREAEKLKIQNNVCLIDGRQNINDLWGKADIHLLTSVTESFCLVIAEAKARGIPTLMFDIPFLELTKSDKGVVKVPQGDIYGMKKAMVTLLKNQALRTRLGKEARESLIEFNDDAVWESWRNAFDVIKGKALVPPVSDVCRLFAEQTFWGWERYCNKNLWAVRMTEHWNLLTKTSMRPLAFCLSKVVSSARKIRRKLGIR